MLCHAWEILRKLSPDTNTTILLQDPKVFTEGDYVTAWSD